VAFSVSIADLDTVSSAEEGKCPACQGYLHMYASECFGCGHDRGSAYETNIAKLTMILDARSAEDLCESVGVRVIFSMIKDAEEERAEERAKEGWPPPEDPVHDVAVRLWAYEALRVHPFVPCIGALPQWSIPTSKVKYLGGLEYAPHEENAQLLWQDGRVRLIGDRSRQVLADIDPARVLGVSAQGTLDEVLGGATFGFYSGGAMFMQSMQPTEGGALKIVFVDEEGVWRAALIGNRTGLTDKRFSFRAYQAWTTTIGYLCQYAAGRREIRETPEKYAAELGIITGADDQLGEQPQELEDTKICPDCAETVKSAAKICRYCRHSFSVEDQEPQDASGASQNAEEVGLAAGSDASPAAGETLSDTINAIEAVVYDDWEESKMIGDSKAKRGDRAGFYGEALSWGRRAAPILRAQRQTLQSLTMPPGAADVVAKIVPALDLWIEGADMYAAMAFDDGLSDDDLLAEGDAMSSDPAIAASHEARAARALAARKAARDRFEEAWREAWRKDEEAEAAWAKVGNWLRKNGGRLSKEFRGR
jgi:hypothetical protein